jgi:hypothetical protein
MSVRRGNSGEGRPSRLEANAYIRGVMAKDAGYGSAKALSEQLGVLGAARGRLGASDAGVVTGSDGKPYQVFAKTGQDYTAMRDDTLKRAGGGTGNARFDDEDAFDAAVAESYGAAAVNDEIAERFTADAHAAHMVGESARIWAEKGAGNALRNAGADLVANKPEVAAKALEAMNITADKLAAKYGPSAAESFKAEIAAQVNGGNLKGALQQLGLTEEQLSGVLKPEVNDWWTAHMPELKDVPVLNAIPNYGYAGAAAAGAGALAYHLMANGLQQQDPAAYATTVQAMNAY